MHSKVSEELLDLKFSYLSLLFEKEDIDQVAKEWYASSYTGELGEKTKEMIQHLMKENAYKYNLRDNPRLKDPRSKAASFREFVRAYDQKVYRECGKKNANECLEYFALRGDKARVLLAIEKGANVWDWGMEGAARGGHKDLALFFIEQGADDWNSGMYAAAEGGHKDLVLFFIEQGADDCGGGMRAAAERGHKDLVIFFIEKGARNWNSGMYGAARGGHKDLVLFFIEQGADDWNRGMYAAARGGHVDLVLFFIEKGAIPTEEIKKKFNL